MFFSGFPKEQVQLSKPSIQNKLNQKMIVWRIILVMVLNLIQITTLNMRFFSPRNTSLLTSESRFAEVRQLFREKQIF